MYDLLDLIEGRLSSMDRWIHNWMTSNDLIKSALLDEIKSINKSITAYHNKYVPCKHWERDGTCRYGNSCMFLHEPVMHSNNQPDNKQTNQELQPRKDTSRYSQISLPPQRQQQPSDSWSTRRSKNQRRKRYRKKQLQKQKHKQRKEIDTELEAVQSYFENQTVSKSHTDSDTCSSSTPDACESTDAVESPVAVPAEASTVSSTASTEYDQEADGEWCVALSDHLMDINFDLLCPDHFHIICNHIADYCGSHLALAAPVSPVDGDVDDSSSDYDDSNYSEEQCADNTIPDSIGHTLL